MSIGSASTSLTKAEPILFNNSPDTKAAGIDSDGLKSGGVLQISVAVKSFNRVLTPKLSVGIRQDVRQIHRRKK
jgi:hypothetical protein